MGGGPLRGRPPILVRACHALPKLSPSGRRAARRVIPVANREQVLLRARRRVLVRLLFRVAVVEAARDRGLTERGSETREAGALPVVPHLDVLEEGDVLL